MEGKKLIYINKFIYLRIIILIILIFPFNISASIVINEISWMGQKDSYSKEWIELFNPTEEEINLNKWNLQISKTKIPLSGIIKEKSYYLLEKTNDNTVNTEKADLIFKKALNNKGEIITLTNSINEVVDIIDCSKGWFAGDNKTKQTMERKANSPSGKDKTSWQTSKEPNGTPKKENSIVIEKKEKSLNDNVSTVTKESQNKIPIPFNTYLVAGIIATLSSTSVLVIKKIS